MLDDTGDITHLRCTLPPQPGYNVCSLGIIDPAVLIPFEAEDEDDIFPNLCKARDWAHGYVEGEAFMATLLFDRRSWLLFEKSSPK